MGEGEGSRARGGVASTSCDAFIAEHLLVYATARWHYVVAGSGDKSRWRILKISHEESPAGRGLVVAEDRTEYDEGQCARIIAAIADGNAATGGARQVARGVALLGSIRLVTGHHLILAKERVPLGTVCGHAVYGVGATELVRVASASPRRNARDAHRPPRRAAADANAEERRLKRLLSRVDLTGGFFFSHTYRLTATLQANAFDPNAALRRDFDSMFAWNAHLSHPLRAALGEDAASRWLVPLVHGFFSQRVVDLVGRRVRIALVARRSRHFAGTRYRRRGVNEEGHVANEVETEQIVDDPGGRGFGSRRVPAVSSVVQTRGSIPLFWTQELSARVARPEITLQRFDPTHAATARHFQRLDDRFGPPTLVLSLVRSQERRAREGALRGELAAALHRVNSRLPEARERVACVHWDFAKHMTRRGGGGGGGGGVKRGDGVSGEARNPSNPPLEPPPPPPPPSPSPAPATTPGLLELTRVAAGALELTGVFVVAPVAGLRSAEKRRATDGRGGPVSRATTAWREARCELFTGMDVVGDDARAAPLGGGDPDAPAPGAGRSANPWKHAVGVITPNDSSAPNVPRASSVGVARQRGVLRSHCIDCLDRTNVAQFAFGLASLAAQLEALGIGDGAPVAPDGTLAGVLMRAYRAMGNALALQYGGSEAHAKVREFRRDERAARDVGEEEEGERVAPASFFGFGDAAKRLGETAASSSARFLTSARRFYSNAVTDADKQEGIDLFLGLRDGPRRGEREHDAGDEPSSGSTHRDVDPPPIESLNWPLLNGTVDPRVGATDDEWTSFADVASPPPAPVRVDAAEDIAAAVAAAAMIASRRPPRAVFSAPPHRRDPANGLADVSMESMEAYEAYVAGTGLASRAESSLADANDEWNAGAAALEYAGLETARAVTLRVGGDPRVSEEMSAAWEVARG